MNIGKQQEALLFTLTFEQLDRLYGGIELTPLEQELFRRCKELQEEQDNVDKILDNYSINIETLEYDLQQLVDKSDFLQIGVDILQEELAEKEVEINNLEDEIKQLHTNTNSESEF